MSVRCVSGAVGGVSHRGGEPARPSLTDYSGDSPMRKPRPAATRTIVLAVLALILVASCQEARSPGAAVDSQSGPVAGTIGGSANAPGGFAAMRDRAAEVPMAAKS